MKYFFYHDCTAQLQYFTGTITAQLQRMEETLPGYPGKLFTQVHKKTLRWVEGFSVFNKDVG